jgi:hypothetical protein
MAGGAAISRVFSALLYGLTPFDHVAYAGVSLFLAAVAMVAIYLPARRSLPLITYLRDTPRRSNLPQMK